MPRYIYPFLNLTRSSELLFSPLLPLVVGHDIVSKKRTFLLCYFNNLDIISSLKSQYNFEMIILIISLFSCYQKYTLFSYKKSRLNLAQFSIIHYFSFLFLCDIQLTMH